MALVRVSILHYCTYEVYLPKEKSIYCTKQISNVRIRTLPKIEGFVVTVISLEPMALVMVDSSVMLRIIKSENQQGSKQEMIKFHKHHAKCSYNLTTTRDISI